MQTEAKMRDGHAHGRFEHLVPTLATLGQVECSIRLILELDVTIGVGPRLSTRAKKLVCIGSPLGVEVGYPILSVRSTAHSQPFGA